MAVIENSKVFVLLYENKIEKLKKLFDKIDPFDCNIHVGIPVMGPGYIYETFLSVAVRLNKYELVKYLLLEKGFHFMPSRKLNPKTNFSPFGNKIIIWPVKEKKPGEFGGFLISAHACPFYCANTKEMQNLLIEIAEEKIKKGLIDPNEDLGYGTLDEWKKRYAEGFKPDVCYGGADTLIKPLIESKKTLKLMNKLKKFHSINKQSKFDGNTFLHYVIKNIDRYYNINKQDYEDELLKEIYKLIESYLKKGHNPNIPNFDGITPLMLAAKKGHFYLVKLLIKYNAHIFAKNYEGKTVFDILSEELNKTNNEKEKLLYKKIYDYISKMAEKFKLKYSKYEKVKDFSDFFE